MSEQTNKFFIDASFNHLIEVKNNGDALLTIHNDGTITAAEHLKPTETAAEVLRIMRKTWMADAQSIKIRDQQERIKRLEKALDLVRPYCSFVHHSKKHQHAYNEPCPVVALIEKTKEAKP
jgi:DNA polymerase IIIc chi subunit